MKVYKILYSKTPSIKCELFYKEFSNKITKRISKYMNEPKSVNLKNGDQIVSLEFNHNAIKVYEQSNPYISIWYSTFGYNYTIFVESDNILHAIKEMVTIFKKEKFNEWSKSENSKL